MSNTTRLPRVGDKFLIDGMYPRVVTKAEDGHYATADPNGFQVWNGNLAEFLAVYTGWPKSITEHGPKRLPKVGDRFTFFDDIRIVAEVDGDLVKVANENGVAQFGPASLKEFFECYHMWPDTIIEPTPVVSNEVKVGQIRIWNGDPTTKYRIAAINGDRVTLAWASAYTGVEHTTDWYRRGKVLLQSTIYTEAEEPMEPTGDPETDAILADPDAMEAIAEGIADLNAEPAPLPSPFEDALENLALIRAQHEEVLRIAATRDALVDQLTRERDHLRFTLDQRVQRHEADIQTIGNRLMREAEHRGWCSDYDDVVESLNQNLNVELPVRAKDYDVTETYTVTIRRTVSARDEDDAAEQVQNDISTSFDRLSRFEYNLDNYGWQVDSIEYDHGSTSAEESDC